MEFFQGMDETVMCPIANAASFLEINELRDVIIHVLANMVRSWRH